jgi:hypothetical protein
MTALTTVPPESGSMQGIDFGALDRDGFTVIPNLIPAGDLVEFERCLAVAGERLAAARGIDCAGQEPLTAVIKAAGVHRSALFDHIKRLWVIERLTGDIGRRMDAEGLFRHAAIDVPIFWPTLRTDLPGETIYSFPLHQDYVTVRSHVAWRLWVPLRDVDGHHGTLQIAVGSHRQGPYRYVTENTEYPHIDREALAEYGFEIRSFDLPAGAGVLFDPMLVHGSVPNKSDRAKYVMLLHLQDLAQFANPDDPEDPLAQFFELTRINLATAKKTRR